MSINTPERFWTLVNKDGDCWLWTLSTTTFGYGQWFWKGKIKPTHRISWEVTRGRIPKGKCVCHTCDNPLCVRPEHLFLASQRENLADMRRKGRGRIGPSGIGELNGRAKLTVDDVRAIRNAYANGSSLRVLGRQFSVDFTHISSIVRRRTWRHVE